MAVFRQLTAPVMRPAAGFHADQARWLLGQERHYFCARQGLAERHLAPAIHTVQTEAILCQINPDRCNVYDDSSIT